jgi:starch synthase
MQFVMLGSGSPAFEKAYQQLARRHPRKAVVRVGFDAGLSHRIEAACDFYLMPSRFEPCGLNQMYSLRYGAIPIVRRTGGLDDSVLDPTDDPEHANGIKFTEYSVRALSKAIRKALIVYEDKPLLKYFRKNAMTADFSWERTSLDYLKLYRQIVSR